MPASFIAPTPYSNTPVPHVAMPARKTVLAPKAIHSVATRGAGPASAISTARKAASTLKSTNSVLQQQLAAARAVAAQVSAEEARGNKGRAIALRRQALAHIRSARSIALRLAQEKATYERSKIVAGGLVLAAQVESNGQTLQATAIRQRISRVKGGKLTFAVPAVLQHGSVAEAKAAENITQRQGAAAAIFSVNGLSDVQLGDLGSTFSHLVNQAADDVKHAADQAVKAVSGAVKSQACAQAGAATTMQGLSALGGLAALSYGGTAVPAPPPDDSTFTSDIPSSSASSGYVPQPTTASSTSSATSAAEKAALQAAQQYAQQVVAGQCRPKAPVKAPPPVAAGAKPAGNGKLLLIAGAGALIAAKALAIF